MKKLILFCTVLFFAQPILHANPSDYVPVAIFSELAFDSNNNWTMELYFPIGWSGDLDSVVLEISGVRAKVNINYQVYSLVKVINIDSLSVPLSINRNGDKIKLYSYPYYSPGKSEDSLMFGDYQGATVGAPDSGYSILRFYTKLSSNNYYSLDCLTKHSSLGVINDTAGLAGKLIGHLYDKDNKLITRYYTVSGGDGLIFFESLLNISSDGSFTTSIFNTKQVPNLLDIRMVDWEYFHNYLQIEPIDLKNIHPDTVIYRDIHVTDTCLFCVSVQGIKDKENAPNEELALINYPNPFNLSTNFYIKVPDKYKNKSGTISIYNINGKLIRTIPFVSGSTTYWDSRDIKGNISASGIYYYSLIIDNQVLKNGSMILLK